MDDVDKMKILEELGDLPEEMYDELVADYVSLMKGKIGELQELLDRKDYDEFGNLAHFIKGASVNLRLPGPQEHARILEFNSRHRSDLEQLQPQIENLKRELYKLESV